MAILVIGVAAKRKVVTLSQDWFQISERCRFSVDQLIAGNDVVEALDRLRYCMGCRRLSLRVMAYSVV